MRNQIINLVVSLLVFLLITFYSLSSPGGDIIYIFLVSILIVLQFIVSKYLNRQSNRVSRYLTSFLLIFISIAIFYFINEKKREIEPTVTTPFP
jgi:multisubunit Na+/H+ antiporter MnhB subunit